jgi:CRP/FNR family transcriptional regulator
VARLVDFLSKFEYGEATNRVNLMTVHEMADMLGVTPESVSRILAEFKRNHTLHRVESCMQEKYTIDTLRLQHEARQ